ncbi:AKAP7 2'5' RNA ligase-like domain-containing protein [Schizophyllum amplum]|uniref:AKAP7 2'5' RNA ligase-like domain-containing protein n=1 Tax=Schizophyllum amplum TaxID=97359 RepID=A0A550BWF8_9AGAR|nr:AKAP7 2'5' RNA ligase-like domain-containing protein [Auriculariopsis ampla]
MAEVVVAASEVVPASQDADAAPSGEANGPSEGTTSMKRAGKGKRGKGKKRAAPEGDHTSEAAAANDPSKKAKGGGAGTEQAATKKKQPPRPTHFLSLSLATDPDLRARLSTFGDTLLASIPPIAGLDRSIVIDPRRVHLTLGVMRLEKEDAKARDGERRAEEVPEAVQDTVAGPAASPAPAAKPKKTLATALALLHSLAPQLAALGPARVDLDRLGVLKPQKGGREANVLWVGPTEAAEEGSEWKDGNNRSSLRAVADLVHQTFRREGYITETRPLKLHATLLNTTHRKPRKRLAFSYADVLQSKAIKLLGATEPGAVENAGEAPVDGMEEAVEAEKAAIEIEAEEQIAAGGEPIVSDEAVRDEIAVDAAATVIAHAPPTAVIPRDPIPIALGSYEVRAVHLCAMGSRGPDNEYVSLGCVEF